MNLKQVGVLTGYHQSTIRKVLDELEIEPEAKHGVGGKSLHVADAQTQLICAHLRATRKPPGMAGGTRKQCTTCGEYGHTPQRCPDSSRPRQCPVCQETKARSAFPARNRTLSGGTRTKIVMSTCRSCDKARLAHRYRTDKTARFRSLLSAACSRSRKINREI